MMRVPIVGIPCDRRVLGDHAYDLAGEKYIAAVRDGARAFPLLVPVLTPPVSIAELLGHVDGLLFTGALSNVAPHHYGGDAPRPGTRLDEARDETAIPVMRAAIDAGVPVLCICRGFQELNVVLGGTLHQHLQELPGHLDHRAPQGVPVEEKYLPAHQVRIVPDGAAAAVGAAAADGAVAADGLLARLLEGTLRDGSVEVNSLHEQGIDRVAPPLRVEAVSVDGVVEALSMKEPKGFVLGVQWHAEWNFADDPVSVALFTGFRKAVESYAQSREKIA